MAWITAEAAAARLGYSSYLEYLSGTRWQKFRDLYETSKLPKKCVACDCAEYVLHHLTYENVGGETLLDVIPVCHRCHKSLHNAQKRDTLSWERPDLTFKKIFQWSQNQTDEKFAAFHKIWSRAAKIRGQKFKRNPKPDSTPPKDDVNFYKIARDLRTLRQYVKDGYTTAQIAQMYKVSIMYVSKFMDKHPEYFE
jgi:hypothetical protein